MNADDLQKLVTHEMPFGKYQGRLIADLPPEYLHWFARAGFPSGELGRLLSLMREIDHNGLKPLLTPLRQRNTSSVVAIATTEAQRLPEDDSRLPLEARMPARCTNSKL